jgi:CDP-glucose 4,6-dehydratase
MREMEKLYNGVFKDRKVLVTGHTGFKGSWLTILLNMLGAKVYGYSLEPPTNPSLYVEANLKETLVSCIGDIRDLSKISSFIREVKPDIIIHMAAQPLVRDSYKIPVETFATNVMGTVNLLESVRLNQGHKMVVVNVTTDKCYENREWHWGYRENEPMGGYDPYSNSKGCSELVTASYRNSFFNVKEYKKHQVALASARAGNVIGGGDWANDRLIPDFMRAISNKVNVNIRSPYAIRPWQHVLEPLNGYLTLAEKLFSSEGCYAEGWNFGPDDSDAKNVEWIISEICTQWGDGASYTIDKSPQLHEANYLKLDCSKAKAELLWYPKWDIKKTLTSIVYWNKAWLSGQQARTICENQIADFFKV